MSLLYDFEVTRLDGKSVSLSEFSDRVLLIVNVASRCGFTKQYAELQQLYDNYQSQGLEILAFPCNQFAGQEPGDIEEIETVCRINWGLTFPVFQKILVNGKNAHPLYRYLKRQGKGFLGSPRISWNFTKFIVDRQGKVCRRFAPMTTPNKLESTLKKYLF
ncbi:MAG: glutathione peroxidase [Coxiellaceae bacterium]|nr:glutathione peroxidase [Coxiellaceae bacterium]|tara:strand:- start:5284 stop:5766 length:483 start_codon:yes stop_codon:yes gene_type:complete